MSRFHKSLIAMLNVALLLVFPFVIVGIALSIVGGIFCMLTGVPFHTIMSHSFTAIMYFVLWIMVMIYMGDNLVSNK